MSSDHNQRQMDFILEQQAKFEVAIAKLEDNLARTAEQSRENTANIAKLGEIILSLANYNEDQDEKIAAQDGKSPLTTGRSPLTKNRLPQTNEGSPL